jgi:hypothetical protein
LINEETSKTRGLLVDLTRANRAIDALRKPDASLDRVVNTVRQSLAEVIEELIAENDRLNKWADSFSDAQLKERRLAEERIKELERQLAQTKGQ